MDNLRNSEHGVAPMRGRKALFVVRLQPAQRADLESMHRSTKLSAGVVRRARLILLIADGQSLDSGSGRLTRSPDRVRYSRPPEPSVVREKDRAAGHVEDQPAAALVLVQAY